MSNAIPDAVNSMNTSTHDRFDRKERCGEHGSKDQLLCDPIPDHKPLLDVDGSSYQTNSPPNTQEVQDRPPAASESTLASENAQTSGPALPSDAHERRPVVYHPMALSAVNHSGKVSVSKAKPVKTTLSSSVQIALRPLPVTAAASLPATTSTSAVDGTIAKVVDNPVDDRSQG